MSHISQSECTAGISRAALKALRENGHDSMSLLAYRAKFMCMRIARGIHQDTEIRFEPMAQPAYKGSGPRPVIAPTPIAIVIIGDETPVVFAPGKVYWLHFSEAMEENKQ